jgi:microcystin-dependent protein
MATVTASYNWVSGETVTPTKLNSTAAPTVAVADNEVTTAKILDGAITTAKVADGAITQAKLNGSVVLVPAGAVMPFAMNSAPTGWLAADGSNVNRTTYAALFSAISTTYGAGDGSTTFALPDLRGYFVRGSGTNSDGTASGTFGAKQADELKSHTHGAALTYLYGRTGVTTNSIAVGGDNADYGRDFLAATGGTETRPKNIAMLYCIKF